MRIGVVGCGWHSRATHGPCLQRYRERNPGITLAACCDLNSDAAETYRNDFGFLRSHTDFQTMLREEALDAVWIIVPEHQSAAVSVIAMDAGIPVFMEKPPGMNKEEVQRLFEKAESGSIPHRVAFNRRHAPITRKLVEKLRNRSPEKQIFSIAYDMVRISRKDADFSTTAIHAIDAAKFIAGSDYENLRFQYGELPHIARGVTNIVAAGNFQNGTLIQLNIYPYSGMALEKAVVRGEGFSYELKFPLMERSDGSAGLVYAENGQVEMIPAEEDWLNGFGFYEENASFLDALRAGRDLTNDLRSSIQSAEIMEAIRNRVKEYHI